MQRIREASGTAPADRSDRAFFPAAGAAGAVFRNGQSSGFPIGGCFEGEQFNGAGGNTPPATGAPVRLDLGGEVVGIHESCWRGSSSWVQEQRLILGPA